MQTDINVKIDLAVSGNAQAVEEIVKGIEQRIYGLAIKMLYHHCDAEDATQEILIKIVTRLGTFKKKSAFSTWAMKIASNHLLNRKKALGLHRFTFSACEDMIVRNTPDPSSANWSNAEQDLMVQEMRIVCVQGLFQCLDRHHRIAYILSATMDVTGPEGAAILDITPANFRKRVSRARKRIQDFLVHNCDLFDQKNPCNCHVQAVSAVNADLMDPSELEHLDRSDSRMTKKKAAKRLKEMDVLSRQVALMRSHPEYLVPGTIVGRIREMLDTGTLGLNNTLN
ncbi:MAG: sigma-70 family RNA polymerase sigma factor [Desulfobacterales bacterium]|nr:sigma-70 family RNA polymerase sigma factor [Desulfobacterales bacterium]